MITAVHAIRYSANVEAIRAFFRDVLACRSVDAGRGWLIFARGDVDPDCRRKRVRFVPTQTSRGDLRVNLRRLTFPRRLRSPLAGITAALIATSTATACAQSTVPKSQLAIVTQYVAGTKIEITYRRPVARGRALFGALVPYGKVWTPSADTAARISISTPIVINGSQLAAGSYSIWAVPDSTSWTVMFNSASNVFHLAYPSGRDVLQVKSVPTRGAHVETLEFAFPMTDADSARLELRWGTTVVPLSIKAKP